MGCKSVSSKKPTVAVLGNAPSQGAIKSIEAPAALPIDIKIAVKFDTEIVLDQNFRDNNYVKDIINDIKKKLPIDNCDYIYTYLGKNLNEISEEKISSLVEIYENNLAEKNNYKKEIKITIEVFIVGLPNLAKNLIREFYTYNYIAKPLTDPFEIAIFDKNLGKIHIESFSNSPSDILYSELSAYCNGKDHLYISGGEDKNTINKANSKNVMSTSIWNIDLINKTVYKSKSKLKNPRKLHSMIYIPNNFVFIVGGLEVKEVEYYDIEKKEVLVHSELNEERIEPALMIINDSYLYAFTGFYNHKGKDFFERINLRSTSKTWELIKPQFNSISSFTQKFFAVSQHRHGSVIFLGGIHGDSFENNSNFCHIYDYENNTLSLSNFPHITSDFGEKFFYPLDSYNNILIPYINREEISIVRYTRHDGIKKIGFQFDSDVRISLSIYRENEFRLLVDDDPNTRRDKFKATEKISKSRLKFSELSDVNGAVNLGSIDDNIIVQNPNFSERNEIGDLAETYNGVRDTIVHFRNSEYNDVHSFPIEQNKNDQQRDENNHMSVIDKGDGNKLQSQRKIFTNDGNDILKYKFNIANYVNNVYQEIYGDKNNPSNDVTPFPQLNLQNSHNHIITEYYEEKKF